MSKGRSGAAVAVLILLAVWGTAAAQEAAATHMIQRANNHQASEGQLDKFGKKGWRLTAILKAEDKDGGYLYYFVREGKRGPSWENKVVRANNHQVSEKQLNGLGEEGWRLAVVLKAEDKPGTYLYYLVRQKK
jgi:hypothetical protein